MCQDGILQPEHKPNRRKQSRRLQHLPRVVLRLSRRGRLTMCLHLHRSSSQISGCVQQPVSIRQASL